MGLYLPVNLKGRASIAICPRCKTKIQYDALVQDPNNKNYYCKDCVDLYDPWRLPARKTEDISLPHPRKDDDIEPGAW